LVLLWQISARRDKQCPLYRVRNFCDTNHLQTFCKLYHHLGDILPTSEHQKLSKNSEIWMRKMRNNGETPSNCLISAYQWPLTACWCSDIPSKKVNLNAEWPSHGIWVVGEKEESIWAICAMYTGLINLSLEYLKTRWVGDNMIGSKVVNLGFIG